MNIKFKHCLIVWLTTFMVSCSNASTTKAIILNNDVKPQYDKIVFASNRDGEKSIYTMNKFGTNITKLTSGGIDSEPSWSPDSKHIAFSRSAINEDSVAEIFIMNADGTNLQQLTNHQSVSNGAVWSPNGKQIAYYTWDLDNWEIFVASLDGKSPKNITNDYRTQTYPTWSPDGKMIAFHQNEYNSDWNIYRMNLDGKDKKALTQNSDWNWLPAWSPDGMKISFWSQRTGKWKVYSMDIDGNNQKQIITNMDSNASDLCKAVWSPDSTEIAVMMDVDKGYPDIVKFDISTNKFARLTNSESLDYCLDWSNSQTDENK